MHTRLEESLERDIERIRQLVLEMSALAERALRDCVAALINGDRQLAYAVILRDQYIDEKEKEIDRLCLEFLVRQQPVGVHLRLAYSTIKVNLELERVGDYAESVARHILRISSLPAPPDEVRKRIVEMADLAIPMLHDSVEAFVRQDPNLARKVIVSEPAVDALLGRLDIDLIEALRGQRILPEMMAPLVTIGRRFERVADQARNVCMETLYMCTGEYMKHPGADTLRVLFVGEHNACRSQMAEAIAQSLGQPKFVFSSAGIDPLAIDPRTVAFMKDKGFDTSRMAPKSIFQVPDIELYQVIVGVAREAQQAFPRSPRKTVYVDWSIDDPSRARGTPDEVAAAYETTFRFLSDHVRDLVGAVLGVRID
jgi:phosphate transport system protein